MHASTPETVRLEISASVLTRLLTGGHLKMADLRCLDCASMHCLCRSCLKNCNWRASGCEKRGESPCGEEDGGGRPS